MLLGSPALLHRLPVSVTNQHVATTSVPRDLSGGPIGRFRVDST